MAEEKRKASSPTKGALRDAVRTFVAFVIAFLVVKIFGAEAAAGMSGATEGIIVIVTSAIFAFVGKAMRNQGMGSVI